MTRHAGENRILVRHGLNGIDLNPTVGLQALMEVSGALRLHLKSTKSNLDIFNWFLLSVTISNIFCSGYFH